MTWQVHAGFLLQAKERVPIGEERFLDAIDDARLLERYKALGYDMISHYD
jgi:hypothetical protein